MKMGIMDGVFSRGPIFGVIAFCLAGCSASMKTRSRIGPPFMKAWEESKTEHHDKCVELFTQSIQVSQGEAALGHRPGADGELAYGYALEYWSFALAGRAECLKALGRTQEAKSDYEKCAEVSTQALEQGKNIPGWSGSHRGTIYGGRALSQKELGKLSEAIADLEESVKLQNEHCHTNFPMGTGHIRDSVCEQTANDMELLAKWKKELATQGKKGKP